MTTTHALIVDSEESAWDALEKLLSNDNIGAVEFDGWPTIGLKFEGDRYFATLPTGLMRQISEVQDAFNRCYAQIAYQKDARSIKRSERDELELVFGVKKGSTELRADATGLLDRLGDAMKKPSTANIAALTLVSLAIIICGSNAICKVSDNSRAKEEKRLDLLAKAVEKAPDLKNATPEFQKIYRDIVASASDADRITIGSHTLSVEEISTVAKSQRAGGQRIDFSGIYKISAIRRFSKHCMVDVTLPSGEKVRARIIFDRFSDNDVSEVLKAVAKNATVRLGITAMKHEDGYSSARITSIGG